MHSAWGALPFVLTWFLAGVYGFKSTILVPHGVDTPVFNSSLWGRGWTYLLISPQGHVKIQVHPHTGLVYLQQYIGCGDHTLDTTLTIRAIPETLASKYGDRETNLLFAKEQLHVSSVTLNIHLNFNNDLCEHTQPKLPSEAFHVNELQYDLTLSLHTDGCLLPTTQLFKLHQYIPGEFSRFNRELDFSDRAILYNKSQDSVVPTQVICLEDVTSVEGVLTFITPQGHQITSKLHLIFNFDNSDSFNELHSDLIHNDHKSSLRQTFKNIANLKVKVSSIKQHTRKSSKTASLRHRRSTNSDPVFAEDSYSVSIPEGQNAGQYVTTITASDPDTALEGKITYTLQAFQDTRSLSMFSIHPVMGKINTTERLDRESMDIHMLYVIATDHGNPPLFNSAVLTIHVTDINDNPPLFEESPYYADVSESVGVGTTIKTVQASDDDKGLNSKIRYHIVNDAGTVFMVDPLSGSITTKVIDSKLK